MYTPYYKKKRRGGRKKSKGKLIAKIALIIVIVLMVLVAAGAGAYYYLRASGKSSLLQNAETSVPDMQKSETVKEKNEAQETYDPTLFRYDGKLYKYNSSITTILCMGIDQRTETFEKQEISGESGQADSIFLTVMNPETKKVKLISVSRDTMTNIKNYDVSGKYIGDSVNHLGLAYAYGDGEELSCKMMTEAVSELFYDLPIHGYVSVLLSAIAPLNDSVGGVQVTVPEDLTAKDPALYEGAQLTLNGDQALIFVQNRDTNKEGSNLNRMERQKQYALSFISSAKQAVKSNPTLPVTMYQQLSPQMVTNIGIDDAVYLVSEMLGMQFSKDDIISLEGEVKQGAVYEEYYVDDKKLLELVLDTFYKEVPEGNYGKQE